MNFFPRLTRLSARELLGLSLLFNLPFALLQIERGAFDIFVHTFLADHYRQAWFNLWEPRWYLGFSVASYPPLVHQLIALLSRPIDAVQHSFSLSPEPYPGAWRVSSEEAAYTLVLLAVALAYPLVVRSFARLFVGPSAANIAGLLAIFLPGLSLVLWAFGQLPSTSATAVVLLAMTRGHRFLQHGRARHLVQAVALAGVAAATHHGVFLVVPFLGAAVVGQVWLAHRTHRHTSVPPTSVRLQNSFVHRPTSARPAPTSGVVAFLPLLFRLLLWSILSGIVVALVLWPLLAWSRGQSLQAPIDHLSRHNLLQDFKATLFFFWPVYGPLLLALPWAAWAAVRVRRWRLLAPALLALVLLVMGLGGTTPLPRLLYGAGWEWLTYERFAFWAALALVPLTAAGLVLLARRLPQLAGLFLAGLCAVAVLAGGLSRLSQSQPPVVEMAPLAQFLNAPAQRPYRYFTLGFGDQLARLSALTSNGTPDGTYHTARGLPELRGSGLGSIDAVMWTHSAWRAETFLAQAERYGARWAFVNHAHYPAVLRATGWTYRFDIGSVQAWEKATVRPVRVSPPPGMDRSLAAWWWGLCPLVILTLAALALVVEAPWRPRRVNWTRPNVLAALGRLRLWLWALTMVALTLWWFHTLYRGATPWVYFVYQSRLLFASDLAAAATLVVWLVERTLRGARPRLGPHGLLAGGLGLIVASALSLQDSVEVNVTQGVVAHLLLLCAWYLMLVNDPPAPHVACGVLAGVAAAQALLALAQAATQTTAWLNSLVLPWPGALTPHSPGVSVVQTAGGGRWLRAYGTLSHPNILGGYLLVGLAAAVERFVTKRQRRWLGVGWLIALGLLLTFSRSAWVGAAVLAAWAGWRLLRRGALVRANWPRVRRWLAVALGGLALLSLPLLPMLLARSGLGDLGRLEQRSMDDRARLNRAAVEMLLDRRLSGVGAGAFVVRLYQVAGVGLPLEPAHNLPLLLVAELGVPGVAALGLLLAAVVGRLWRRRWVAGTPEVMLGAALAGMLVVGLFDHYWWTMPPARLLLVTVLGLWAGWGANAAAPPIPPGSRAPGDSAQSARQSAERLPG